MVIGPSGVQLTKCSTVIGSGFARLFDKKFERDHVGVHLRLSNFNLLSLDSCNWRLMLRVLQSSVVKWVLYIPDVFSKEKFTQTCKVDILT